MAAAVLYNAQGQRLNISQEIGRGGEGTVHALDGDILNVVKLYHTQVDPKKAAKLISMAALVRPELLKIAAWPITTVHEKPGGPVSGLVMPRVSSYREIHELYGPAHRKRHFPNADWRFLLLAARNVAAAFDVIHNCGHVIGDVNQGNVLVSSQAVIKLIDTDSFQITDSQNTYLCEVGVPQYTPPELQVKGFSGITRTTNHDLFGLAVMIFHLLFLGRHPFAGRYSGSGDMPIEKAIQEFRFAFSAQAGRKQMAPPPNTLSLVAASIPIAKLFERAFAESTASAGRPTAREWMISLESAIKSIHTCSQQSVHKYPTELNQCPWCALEQASGVIYFLAGTTSASATQSIDVARLWAGIEAITLLSLPPLPNPTLLSTATLPSSIIPKPVPSTAIKARANTRLYSNLSWFFCILLSVIVGWNINFFFGLIVFWAGATLSSKIKFNDGGEFALREKMMKDAYAALLSLADNWSIADIEKQFEAKKRDLKSIKISYGQIGQNYQSEIMNQARTEYLSKHFIEDAKIPGIGKKRVATLESWGIETASDLTEAALSSIPGFGPALRGELMIWRRNIENQFRFNPNDLKLQPLIQKANLMIEAKKSKLEAELLAGSQQLEQLSAVAKQRIGQLNNTLEQRKAAYFAARANYEALSRLGL
jgi:DNA-binding helix-hairpin-helix protein with protein kinase domain